MDFKDYPFSAGSLVYIQREQVHAFDFSGHPNGQLVIFTQEFLDQVHTNMRLPYYTPTHLNLAHNPIINLNESDNIRCATLLDELTRELHHPQLDTLIIQYLFSALSLLIHRIRPDNLYEKLSHRQSKILSKFIELLQSHYCQTRDASWYAQNLNTTYKTLNIISKLSTGQTAKELIDAFTVIEIKRQLMVNNDTAQALAHQMNFEDDSNFVKYFKKHTGLTPGQFRSEQQRKSKR